MLSLAITQSSGAIIRMANGCCWCVWVAFDSVFMRFCACLWACVCLCVFVEWQAAPNSIRLTAVHVLTSNKDRTKSDTTTERNDSHVTQNHSDASYIWAPSEWSQCCPGFPERRHRVRWSWNRKRCQRWSHPGKWQSAGRMTGWWKMQRSSSYLWGKKGKWITTSSLISLAPSTPWITMVVNTITHSYLLICRRNS